MKKISAREAFNAGLTRYFTGRPCGRGHIAERMISNGACVDCLNEKRCLSRADAYERTKAWRLANPGARAEEARRYRAKHPGKVAEIKRRHREAHLDQIREADREAKRRIRLVDPEGERRRYTAWRQRKEERLTLTAGRPRPSTCDLCSGASGGIVFDHCHASGRFRGWLCDRCNKILGLVKDSPELLRAMAAYLESGTDGKVDDKAA